MTIKELSEAIENLETIVGHPMFSDAFKKPFVVILKEKQKELVERKAETKEDLLYESGRYRVNETIIMVTDSFNPFGNFDLDHTSSKDIEWGIRSLPEIPAESLQSKRLFIEFLNEGGFKSGAGYCFPPHFYFRHMRTFMQNENFAFQLAVNPHAEEVGYIGGIAGYKIYRAFNLLKDLYDSLYDCISKYLPDYTYYVINVLPEKERAQWGEDEIDGEEL